MKGAQFPTGSNRPYGRARMERGRRAFALLTAIAAMLALAAAPTHAQSPATSGGVLRIRQLDVGQGDAALITTPEGRHILIDAGPNAHAVALLLRDLGIDTLDLVVASHNHADHIGGMPRVFDAVVVRAYVENGLPHTTAIYRRTIIAIEREPGLIYLQATDRAITVGTIVVRILGSPGVDRSQNNNSVGVLLEHGAFKAVFTGDSELPQLSAWLHLRRIPRVAVVKVAHHGSHNGTSAEWVRATRPAMAMISVGGRNSYGHPSPQTQLLWGAAGAQVYRTDRHGTIDIEATRDGRFTIRTGISHSAIR